MVDRYDLVVLGGGAAGLTASVVAGRLGARVALVEREEQPGGDCLFWGCVPSKALLASAKLAHEMRTAARLGLEPIEPGIDFARVMERVHAAVAEAGRRDTPEHLRREGVEVVRGHGAFAGPGLIDVDGRQLRYRKAIIATGSRPAQLPGLPDGHALTNETVFDLRGRPARLAIVGGGSTGVELGQALARLGSAVTIVEAAERLLSREEPEVGRLIAEALADDGVAVETGASVARVEAGEGGAGALVVGEVRVEYDRLLVAVGRRPDSQALGLKRVGVARTEEGWIRVDARLRTTAPHVYAAGDAVGELMYTHVAGYHGVLATLNALFHARRRADHSATPRVVFCDPELASVGLTEAEAAAPPRRPPLVFRHDYADSDRAITAADTRGFAKLVADRRGRLLGATVLAPAAGESIAELARLVRDRATLADLARVVHAYPTFGEGSVRAAEEWWSHRLMNPRGRRLLRPLLSLLAAVDRPRG
jgi:pyruvate/2-oxoglutarate dehydrogenase complex dihydrolipoamide dehydrogenase (E3) component